MDLGAAFCAMCVAYSRGKLSGQLAQGTSAGDATDSIAFSERLSKQSGSDSDMTLTYREFVAAAMMNR